MPRIEPQDREPTIGELVADISRDFSTLIRSEIQLAKSEISFSVKAGGVGAGLLAVAGFFGLMIVILLSIAFAYFLTMTGLHPAWCFLIVAGVYLLIALIAIGVGIKLLKKVRAPQRTIKTAQQIPAALKGNTEAFGSPELEHVLRERGL